MTCEHEWIITEWVVKDDKPYKRHCKKCNKNQTIKYRGGDLWYWVDDDYKKYPEGSLHYE